MAIHPILGKVSRLCFCDCEKSGAHLSVSTVALLLCLGAGEPTAASGGAALCVMMKFCVWDENEFEMMDCNIY